VREERTHEKFASRQQVQMAVGERGRLLA